MSEKREITALVHLLEDPDEKIYLHIKEKLMEIGPECIPLLEKASFEEELGKNSSFFSYPFGEYSNAFKNIIIDLGFTFAFGQHSGVIDLTKDKFELPRFPINEKYGDLNRFKTLTKTLPFKYVKILPEEKYLKSEVNPPEVKIEFIEETNVKNINCYSNEGNVWRESKMSFVDTKTLKITLREKFVGERGRINCSSNAGDGFWRWLGIQFVLAD